jgi:mevalonate kinase
MYIGITCRGGGGLAAWIRFKDLPVGAGLRSSAAMGVALTAALVPLQHRVLHDNNNTISNDRDWSETTQQTPPDAVRSIIDEYSYNREMLLHSTPSGIDNAVASHGRVFCLTRIWCWIRRMHLLLLMPLRGTLSQPQPHPRSYCMTFPFPCFSVHTHVPRSTKALVAGVRTRYYRHRNVVLGILDSIQGILNEFKIILGQQSPQQQQSPDGADKNHDFYCAHCAYDCSRLGGSCQTYWCWGWWICHFQFVPEFIND